MKKNVASQRIGAQMVSATDGSAFTGSVTVYVTIDAGTQAVGSVGSGACTHEGNGYHTYAPSQSETNGDLVAFTFIGTGAVPTTVQVYTGFPQTADNATDLATLTSRLSSARAGYLDNLSGGAVALSSQVDALEAAAVAIEADTQDIQARLPAALVGGRIDASVGAMAADVVTAAAIATDAIDADAIAASAVTEIQSGLALAGGVATAMDAFTIKADLDDIQTRLPAALVGGRMDASVGAIAADAVTAAALAADAVAEIQSGLATAASVAAVEADTQDIQSRLPAALVSGRIDASVGAMAADVITSSSLAASAGTELAAATWGAISEGGETYGDQVRLAAAFAAGDATVQDGDGSYAFRDLADTKNRIAGTISGTTRNTTTRDGT